ncbi:FtsB family cell division protein [Hazenella coriacea]|uniref:Cell division protein FtsB n=1 Tax=Hazenella coriacea TaxID=1179467 RepID=A0A4R3L5M8_9BACL|nr:septum formation initiator family protein [Hazenella coriacea]TCS94285.1 cell division protein FtsB [Hazenella coriacea]
MPVHHQADKILRFRQGASQANPVLEKKRTKKPKLHPSVRRRRLIWLVSMVVFVGWACIQMIIQQFQIWDQQEQLTLKQEELVVVQKETIGLKEAIQKLKSEDYLLELAHRLGYSKPGEQNYIIEGN